MGTQLLVVGLAGSGKSTVGKAVADRLGLRFVDGDSLHPAANLTKMAKGTPLSDDDRDPWVANIIAELNKGDVVIAASLLKRSYREQINKSVKEIVFAQLDAPKAVLEARLAQQDDSIRKDLITAQLATADPLAKHEPGKIYKSDKPVDELVRRIVLDIKMGD